MAGGGGRGQPSGNITAPHWCRVEEMGGDLGERGLLGGMMAEVDGMAGVEGMAGMRVVSESSP